MGGGGGREGGRAPEHYARALRCNMAGPFQICFLRACSCLQDLICNIISHLTEILLQATKRMAYMYAILLVA